MKLFNFALWLAWIAIATIILGGAAYLFIGGSVLFAQDREEQMVIYRQVNNGMVSVNGSILLPTTCHSLQLYLNGDIVKRVLQLEFVRLANCDTDSKQGVPETFFTEFEGDASTEIVIKVGGIKKDVIIK